MKSVGFRWRTIGSVLIAVALWATLLAAIVQRQAILDWWKLYDYTPPAAISALATTDTMTAYARHLFYVNHPKLLSNRTTFTQDCPVNVEKTIVLGCYKPNDGGIYLYKVSDPRLDGVVEVTAAHEMLHAAYERLSAADKSNVDAMLQSYYKNGLKDQRLIDTFKAYQQAGADVTNEMHSIFGTEVAQLPPNLETYYKRYFVDRSKVIAEESKYEAEFTSREQQVAAYDAQLAALKQNIDTHKAQLSQQAADLASLEQTMNAQKSAGNYTAYNANVAVYNAKVDAYNALLHQAKAEIEQYNQIVDARNSIATEEQQLVEALSGSSLPAKL